MRTDFPHDKLWGRACRAGFDLTYVIQAPPGNSANPDQLHSVLVGVGAITYSTPKWYPFALNGLYDLPSPEHDMDTENAQAGLFTGHRLDVKVP